VSGRPRWREMNFVSADDPRGTGLSSTTCQTARSASRRCGRSVFAISAWTGPPCPNHADAHQDLGHVQRDHDRLAGPGLRPIEQPLHFLFYRAYQEPSPEFSIFVAWLKRELRY